MALTRFLQSLLYETSVTDPLVMVAVTIMLVVAGFVACWVPSRRATRINPLEALRYE